MTPTHFDKVRPTYIENWSAALAQLSIPQTDIPLSLAEARALAERNLGRRGHPAGEPDPHVSAVAERLESALAAYREGAFVRLGSRSAKDSRFARLHGLRVLNSDAAIRMLTGDSRRIAYDLGLALRHGYAPHVFARRWYEIPAWAEFRCFMKGRELVGVSQYDCRNLGRRPEIAERAGEIKAAIEEFSERVGAAAHLADFVFDVFLNFGEAGRGRAARVTLLELNPFLPATDACLFSWRDGGDFDGSFRFL
ncbi:MAG TPA: hypothetical protein VF668_08080 [Pyrinomonadaceae bacterium]